MAARAHRPGHAVSVARGRHRGPRRRRLLRSRVRLQLLRHDFVPHARPRRCRWKPIRASCSSGCSARATRRRSAKTIAQAVLPAFSTWLPSEAADLQRTPGRARPVVLNDYLETVREIERRVQKMEARDLSTLDLPDAPAGAPPAFDAAHQSDVRPGRAGVSGEPDARLQLHDGGRGQQPDLQPASACPTRSIRCRTTRTTRRRSTSW